MILWIDPYPTRFPRLADIRRPSSTATNDESPQVDWVQVLKPFALPLEPLPGAGLLHAFFWRSIMDEVARFVDSHEALLVIGKPSLFALAVLDQQKNIPSIYDAMDEFPAFYSGFSRLAMANRELQIVQRVNSLWVTSTRLKQQWEKLRPDLQLVPNGFDITRLPAPKVDTKKTSPKIFGYVGTIAEWFDWDWIIALALARPFDIIRLIGPVFKYPPQDLPRNIELLPACSHENALIAMQDFDVGLIPFIKNELTASVDPIKFYEYRALGLPVISTKFGEMAFRCNEAGTIISENFLDITAMAEAALLFKDDPVSVSEFLHRNAWAARFDAAKFLP
jgi:glycosyltransferase involved in cell wall biosynthesis